MGGRNRSQSEQLDDGSCHPTFEVDQKKKTIEASERKEEERQKFREQTKDTDAGKFRVNRRNRVKSCSHASLCTSYDQEKEQ